MGANCQEAELNCRHKAFQASALPLSYPGTGMSIFQNNRNLQCLTQCSITCRRLRQQHVYIRISLLQEKIIFFVNMLHFCCKTLFIRSIFTCSLATQEVVHYCRFVYYHLLIMNDNTIIFLMQEYVLARKELSKALEKKDINAIHKHESSITTLYSNQRETLLRNSQTNHKSKRAYAHFLGNCLQSLTTIKAIIRDISSGWHHQESYRHLVQKLQREITQHSNILKETLLTIG